jgi:transcriptional regulator with XRE-family HTH domain
LQAKKLLLQTQHFSGNKGTSMSLQLVQKRISLAIKAKKREDELGVRGAAKKCGVDASTLSRLENGAYSTLPDAGTLKKVADWLGTSVSALLGGEGEDPLEKSTLPELVEVHLRADKNLSPKTAKALATMFETLYKQATKK